MSANRSALAATSATFAAIAVVTGATTAGAVSSSVKVACLGDYYSYCSKHAVGSQRLRQCMRTNGLKLSSRCVDALVAAGEVSRAEVARRAAGVE